jgi:hypothetical protein
LTPLPPAKRTIRRTVPLHRAQHEFRHSPALYRGFVGGRGAGKSFVGAYDLIRRAKRGRTYLIGSPTGVLLGDTTYPTFEKIARELGVWRGVKLTPYPNATLSGGVSVRFRTAEDPEKMRGPNLSGVWLDEASLMAENAFKIAIGSLREAGEQGWLSATYTPKGRFHWTYETFATDKPNTSHHRAHTRENPFNPAGFADTLAGQYSPIFARQELGGEYLEIEGAEWPSAWFPESHWFDAWPEHDEITLRVVAVDSSMGRRADRGDYSAVVFLVRTRDGTLWAEANIERRPITKVVGDGIAEAKRWQRETRGVLDGFGVESDVFQVLVADEFARQSREQGVMLPVYEMLTGGVEKVVRGRRLTPYLSRGNFRWRNTPGTQLLVRQMREFPVGEYDDGWDALEQGLRLAIEISHERA